MGPEAKYSSLVQLCALQKVSSQLGSGPLLLDPGGSAPYFFFFFALS